MRPIPGKRSSEKQDYIDAINTLLETEKLPPIPMTCLREMNTSALSRLNEWVFDMIAEKHK